MARKYTLSEAARLARVKGGQARAAQRTSDDQREAREALGQKVHPSFFSFAGRLGGRLLAHRYWQGRYQAAIEAGNPDEVALCERKLAKWEQPTGTRIMTQLWQPEVVEQEQPVRRGRGRKRKYNQPGPSALASWEKDRAKERKAAQRRAKRA